MSSRSATWMLRCWIRVRMGSIGRRFTDGDRHRVVALIDAQKPDLELHSADRLIDVIAQTGVENGVVVAAHLVRLLRGECDVADPGLPVTKPPRTAMSNGAAPRTARTKISWASPLGPGKSPSRSTPRSATSSSVPSVTGTPWPVTREDDLVETVMVVDLPTERGGVLGRPALQQETTVVVVEAESHDVEAASRRGACRSHLGRTGASPRTARSR